MNEEQKIYTIDDLRNDFAKLIAKYFYEEERRLSENDNK